METERYQADLAALEEREQILQTITPKISELNIERVTLRDQINQVTGDTQIYRFAQLVFGHDSSADVKRSEVRIIASIWFGSIAAIVAVTGTVLAFAALVLINWSDAPKRKKQYVRRLFVKLSRRMKNYREIEKIVEKRIEVPVEVVVEKKVEVPIEKTVYKYIPVPGWGPESDPALSDYVNSLLHRADGQKGSTEE
jgi:hypothetical protein